LTIDNARVNLQVWDTAGQEKFRTITSGYYRGANGVVIVFDITNKHSFDNVKRWFTDAQRVVTDGVIIIVGNKNDLNGNRVVSESDAKEVADLYGVPYFETSGKNGDGVDDAFYYVARKAKEDAE